MKVSVLNTILNEERCCVLVKENTVEYDKFENLNKPEKVDQLLRDVFQLDKRTEEYDQINTGRK